MGKQEWMAAGVRSVLVFGGVALLIWGPAEGHDPALIMLGLVTGIRNAYRTAQRWET
ncbi:MAG: hypothetical protein IH796_04925 [Deltaproteobacteria bacterium]|nr:hypothetical protein [Deltaproteobacteria bacterium]